VFLKVGGIVTLGAIWRGKGGENTKRDDRGTKQHKWGENAQLLIDY